VALENTTLGRQDRRGSETMGERTSGRGVDEKEDKLETIKRKKRGVSVGGEEGGRRQLRLDKARITARKGKKKGRHFDFR